MPYRIKISQQETRIYHNSHKGIYTYLIKQRKSIYTDVTKQLSNKDTGISRVL
ncbi:MAG: hypothetical protein JETT_1519 [Candidatus Jettenia ecosi]|uniref:Uncharacterized protein n=1 Tax=Candidatus Jettenia ecosi TaxID=2494326 RepID=A0A533QBU9_9BACT|nr:MAG: hypothetical protein JETT_1519 [Candidatus Jettenia ecosi]